MTNPHRTLAELLAIEDDPSLLAARCADTGYLLWPLLRNQFLRVLSESMYYDRVTTAEPPPAGRHRAAAQALPRTLWANASRWRDLHGDVLIMASGAGHFQRSGASFNRITDYFALEDIGHTVTIEGLMDWHVPKAPANPRTYYYLPWQGCIDLLGRLRLGARHRAQARELVDLAVRRAAQLELKIPAGRQVALTALVARKIARLPLMASTYRQILRKTGARLVLLEQACYSDLGIFNHVARDMGVRVAEPQHGLISQGHDAYNYAETLRRSDEFGRYLPHDLLGYGRWWCDQVNVPINKHVIGHPHYIEQRAAAASGDMLQTDVLFLSDGFEFDKYLEVARELNERLGGRYRIVLRPHPLERVRVAQRFPEGKAHGLALDASRDIYPALRRSHAVVSEVSTGLFEAVGLAGRALMWATPKGLFSCPERPFASFSSVDELVERVLEPQAQQPQVDPEALWASDWRANYRRYLDSVLGAYATSSSLEVMA